jgi:N-acyl-D-amino-acid deacylase
MAFARFGKNVRDEQLVPLEAAIRRLTSQPAHNLKLISVARSSPVASPTSWFSLRTKSITRLSRNHQYATGMLHVFVNGVQVLKWRTHGLPGSRPRPGWKKRASPKSE